MAAPGRQGEPGTQRTGHAQAQGGGQDHGVAQGALAHEHDGGPLPLGPHGTGPEAGRVVGLEEPSFHGEAG